MNRPTRAVWATASLFLLLACSSSTAQVSHDARLREALDASARRRTGEAPSQETSHVLDMELELVRRLKPESAARIAQAADEPMQQPTGESPVAVPIADFVEGAVPLTVCFDAANSYHPQRKPFDIEWDFGDGRGTASTAQTCHEYIEPGLYAASVTVTDDEGLRDSRTVVVFVRENR